MPDSDDSVVRSEDYRWRYLSTVISVVVASSYSALVLGQAYGLTSPVTGGTWATYSVAFLAVIIYSVGIDAVREARRIRGE